MISDNARPIKNSKLLIIDYLGIYYATLDRERWWEIEDWIVKLLKLCDGKTTVDQLAEKLAKMAEVKKEDLKPTLKSILKELKEKQIIKFI